MLIPLLFSAIKQRVKNGFFCPLVLPAVPFRSRVNGIAFPINYPCPLLNYFWPLRDDPVGLNTVIAAITGQHQLTASAKVRFVGDPFKSFAFNIAVYRGYSESVLVGIYKFPALRYFFRRPIMVQSINNVLPLICPRLQTESITRSPPDNGQHIGSPCMILVFVIAFLFRILAFVSLDLPAYG